MKDDIETRKNITDLVTKVYTQLLGREPNEIELRNYVSSVFMGNIDIRHLHNYIEDGKINTSNVVWTRYTSIDPQDRRTINYFQSVVRNSGYGILGDNIYRTLIKHGYKINDGTSHSNDNYMPHTNISLFLSLPISFFKAHSGTTIGFSMFEANNIPLSWIPGCNTVDRMFVPITQNVDSFKNCGVTVPIDVIPIGIDVDIYNPSMYNSSSIKFDFEKFDFRNTITDKTYKFLVINDGQPRKNNQMIVDAFHQEFNQEISRREVSLVMRLCFGKRDGPGICNIRRFLSDVEMPLLIGSCDCMVNVSSGECGDIPILEGMAMEKPVIVSRGFVHDDCIIDNISLENNQNGFFVDTDRWDVAFQHPAYRGTPYLKGIKDAAWIIPSFDDLKRKMRYVYENRNTDDMNRIKKNARQYILQNRTLDIMIDKMTAVFDKL